MSGVVLVLTEAGLDALVNAQSGSTAHIQISQLGLTEQSFVAAPTLDALPGEFKRFGVVSGVSASETIIHMTGQDTSAETYDLRGLGLYLSDGTLFATFSQEEPLFRKVSIAAFLFSADVAFGDNAAASIDFGDSTFLYPPATEETKGVAEIATQAEVDAGTDDQRIVTPLKLAAIIAAIAGGFSSATESVEGVIELATQAEVDAGTDDERAITPLKLAALMLARFSAFEQSVSITGGGLVRDGGDLSANRVLSVLAASSAETMAGLIDDKALTPASIAQLLIDVAGKIDSSLLLTGTGLVTGGGDMSANRQLDVRAANSADLISGIRSDSAITPAALGPIPRSHFGTGYQVIPGGDPANSLMLQWGQASVFANTTSTISFSQTFDAPPLTIQLSGTVNANLPPLALLNDAQTTLPGSFRVANSGNSNNSALWFALGVIDLS